MANVSVQLQQLQNAPAAQRSDGYNNLLDSIIAKNDGLGPNLVAYVQSITSDNIGVISSRPLLTSFVTRFCTISDNDVKIEAGYAHLT
jgi:COP9 signalosome complex subunit 4